MAQELWRKSALELAADIRTKKVSSREVVDAHLERIAQVNGHVNAVVRVLADEARAGADAADAALAAGKPLGVFHGVPFTIKENIDVVGYPTTQGIPALAQAIPTLNAPAVDRMLGAGAIPIGRTNLPDLGLRIHTDSALYGRTKNPWKADRTAGGSSGGEGAAHLLKLTGHQGKEIGGLGEGVVPNRKVAGAGARPFPIRCSGQVTAGDAVAVGEEHRAGAAISLDPHPEAAEQIRAIRVEGDAAEAFGFALGGEQASAHVQPLQGGVRVGSDPHPGFEHEGALGRGRQQESIALELKCFGRQG